MARRRFIGKYRPRKKRNPHRLRVVRAATFGALPPRTLTRIVLGDGYELAVEDAGWGRWRIVRTSYHESAREALAEVRWLVAADGEGKP